MPNPNTREAWINLWKENADRYGRDLFHIARFRFVASLCVTSQTLLDVASGPGWLGDYLPKTCTYDRLDFCEDALKLRPGRFLLHDVLSFPVLFELWDSVVCMELLEHLDDPGPVIRYCVGLCSLQAVFTVPNNRLGPDQEPFHIRKYDIDSFRDLFYKLGYSGHFTTFILEGSLICQIRK